MNPLDALEKYFGFREFREGQQEIIEAILEGNDALVIMPTGGGKSLCYQLPALVRPGTAIIVSPLIALMKDQVDALCAKGIDAGFINSSLSLVEQRQRIHDMETGKLKLVYVAPERFRNRAFLERLANIQISLFAVDEAHCISQWGHDFRPDYYRIGQVLDQLSRPQVLALTATATPAVREDILRSLNLSEAKTFVAGFARPNLSLRVVQVQNDAEKFDRLQRLVAEKKTGIIYCATRKKVEAVAVELAEWGVPHVAYHGGMDENTRSSAQEKFIAKQADVAVATNAFGMGIDRDDLRFVAHFEIPGSIEAYYQEVGRAGRDGHPSSCEMLFLHPDVRVQEFFIEGSNPGFEVIAGLWGVLRSRANEKKEVELTISDLASLVPNCKNDMAVSSALSVLSKNGYLERYDIPGKHLRGTRLLKPETAPAALSIDREALDEKERIDRDRLRQMIDFAYSQECRQKFILGALGEHASAPCGKCDRCLSRSDKKIRPPEGEEPLVVQKLLSCVARMSWRTPDGWQGRFGKQRIIQVLQGAEAKPIKDLRLDQLSTFGILSHLDAAYLRDLLSEAVSSGLLEVGTGQYPVLSLTRLGESVMRGSRDYRMAWPIPGGAPELPPPSPKRKTATAKDGTAKDVPPGDRELFEKLREQRASIAKAKGKPAYLIAQDAALRELASRRPSSAKAALAVQTLKAKNLRPHLPAFIQTIRDHHSL